MNPKTQVIGTGCLALALGYAVRLLIFAALIAWGVIPLFAQAWGINLPFWPLLLTVMLVSFIATPEPQAQK